MQSPPFTQALLQEMNLLLRFSDSSLDGLKIHHTAQSEIIEAARRLYEKGLTTRVDGGYLTELGREAHDVADLLTGLLTPADDQKQG